MSIFEIIGIFSLGPFITMVLTPEIIDSNEAIILIKSYSGILNNRELNVKLKITGEQVQPMCNQIINY